MTANPILDNLYKDHWNHTGLLTVLDREFATGAEGHTPDFDVVTGVLEYCTDYPDRYHHPLEELMLETLMQKEPGAGFDIDKLRLEHERLAQMTQELAAEISEFIAGDDKSVSQEMAALVHNFVETYLEHMRQEEKRLFVLAENLLSVADWERIANAYASRPDPLFSPHVQAEYRKLKKRLCERSGVESDHIALETVWAGNGPAHGGSVTHPSESC